MIDGILNGVEKTEYVKPGHNTMPAFDMRNGRFVKGVRGEMLLNGGNFKYTGIVGFPNTYKSTVDNYFIMSDCLRYKAAVLKYDSEGHANTQRLEDCARFLLKNPALSIDDIPNFVLTDVDKYAGEKFFDLYKQKVKELMDKKVFVTTPFADAVDKNIKVRYPFTASIDSISKFRVTEDVKIAKTELGSSERNAGDMNQSRFKSQLILSLIRLLGTSGGRMSMVGHIGKEFSIGNSPHQRDEKKMQYLAEGYKIKNAPDDFLTLTNDTWCLLRATPLRNSATKQPEYPSSRYHYNDRDCETNKLTIIPLRGKNGPSGDPFILAMSQNEGILENVTNLHYLRDTCKYYGLYGGDRSYNTAFLPTEKLSRTTARDKMDDNPLLARAVEITAELKLAEYNSSIPKHLLCSPEELYESLKKKYDWNELLNTRRYWLYEHLEKDALPYLSIYDLLLMKEGSYVPFWKK